MVENPVVAIPREGQNPSSTSVSRMSFASVCEETALIFPLYADRLQVAALPPQNAAKQTPTVTSDNAKQSALSASNSDKSVSGSTTSTKASAEQGLGESLARLEIKGQPDPPSNLHEHGPLETLRQSAKMEDEKTHLSVSSTKAPSLDGKSIASMTTFAMDEKESIRPDDSASVQAAEEEDSNSGPGSGAQNSRFGSEAGAKAFHSQLQEISQQRGIPLPRRIMGAAPAEGQANGIPQNLPVHQGAPNLGHQGLPIVPQYSYSMPDEKLLEALNGPKDRLFVLQLEQQFIQFLQDPQASSLDIPPCNSFFRLLAHRLGDYYRLSHLVDNHTNAVRLFKTNESQNTQLPTPLSVFQRKGSSEEGQQIQPSMKIMRRAGGAVSETQIGESTGNTNVSSMVPSKAGSEDGDESQKVSGVASPTGSTAAKDKATQTREEREAKYKEARDRIFADYKERENGEGNPSTEASTQASRASSVNGRKKKKNNNKNSEDDGFQARSAFNVVYPNRPPVMAYDQGLGSTTYFNYYSQQQNGSQVFPPGFGQNYPGQQFQPIQQPQFYPGQMFPSGPMPANNGMMIQPGAQQQFVNYQYPPQPIMNQYYPQMQQTQNQMSFQPSMQPSMMPSPNMYNATMSRPESQMSNQSWGQNNMQNPYQVYPAPQSSYQPQAPPQAMQQGPMTSSNNPAMPYAFGQLPYQSPSPSGPNAHPVPGSYNRPTFNAQSQPFVPGKTVTMNSGADFGGRQASHMGAYPGSPQGNSGPSYLQPGMQHGQLMPALGNPSSASPRKASTQNSQAPSPATGSTISKWGTPSLPPKPPPPASTLPNMPTFQNGTYTKAVGTPQDTKAH